MTDSNDRERLARLEQRQDDQAERLKQLWPLTELFGRLSERIGNVADDVNTLGSQVRESDALTSRRFEEVASDAKRARELAAERKDKRRGYNIAMVSAVFTGVTLVFFILVSVGVFH